MPKMSMPRAWAREMALVMALGMALVMGFSLAACGGGDAGGPVSAAGATSTLCPGLTGGEAILWDSYNGVIRTDSVLPPPLPTGGTYFHSSFPLLGFVYPPGWVPAEISSATEVGVNLLRGDNQAIWRYYTATVNGVPNPRTVRDFEISTMLAFFGINANEVANVCFNEDVVTQGGGIQTAFSNVLIRARNHSAVIAAYVTPFPGLPSSSVHVRLVAAPTAEFSARCIDSFLAIDWQLLIGDSRNLFDRDGDGWRDGVDNFPDDPTRH